MTNSAAKQLRKQLKEQDPQVTFKLFDKDGDGSITAKEMTTTFKELGMPIAKSEAKRILKQFDTDGSGEIEYEEFVLFLRGFVMCRCI